MRTRSKEFDRMEAWAAWSSARDRYQHCKYHETGDRTCYDPGPAPPRP